MPDTDNNRRATSMNEDRVTTLMHLNIIEMILLSLYFRKPTILDIIKDLTIIQIYCNRDISLVIQLIFFDKKYKT